MADKLPPDGWEKWSQDEYLDWMDKTGQEMTWPHFFRYAGCSFEMFVGPEPEDVSRERKEKQDRVWGA